MYTSLDFLKKTEACKAGYSEMLSFFGTSPKIKKVPIPLALCGLVLDKHEDHMEWLLENSIQHIDPTEFKAFYDKWAVSLNHALLWSRGRPTKGNKPHLYDMVKEFGKVSTLDELHTAIERYKWTSINDRDIAGNAVWHSPVYFIKQCHENFLKSGDYEIRRFIEADRTAGVVDYRNKKYFKMQTYRRAWLFSDDPYKVALEFLAEHGKHMPAGKMVTLQKSAEEQITATFTMTDSAKIFDAVRYMSVSGGATAVPVPARPRHDDEEEGEEDREDSADDNEDDENDD